MRTCRSCRAILIADRPEALFGLLAQTSIPPAALERLSQNVSSALDALEVGHGSGDVGDPQTPSRRRWLVALALAASVALAMLIGLPLVRQDVGTEIAEATPVVVPQVLEVLKSIRPAVGGPVRGVELLSSPGEAEVVELAIGDAQVVMIFDKELDI